MVTTWIPRASLQSKSLTTDRPAQIDVHVLAFDIAQFL
jgi:hypothetical protein